MAELLRAKGVTVAIKYSPKAGQILMCDFHGFTAPEMIKNRPVLVLATRPNGHRLVSITCLSTASPTPIEKHHFKLDAKHLPKSKFFKEKDTWIKADMIYTVSFDRLELIRIGSNQGKRIYFQDRLGRETMKKVYSCMLHGLNLGALSAHL